MNFKSPKSLNLKLLDIDLFTLCLPVFTDLFTQALPTYVLTWDCTHDNGNCLFY